MDAPRGGRGGRGRGRGGGGGSGRRDEDPTVALSKLLSSILRHNAAKMGLAMGTDGFILVSDILKHPQVARGNYTVDNVRAVVADNDKQRFSLQEREGKLYIRANQGHSVVVPDLDLKPITDAAGYPVVVHGTYDDVLPVILRDGLNRMGRTHMHFAQGEYGSAAVISGMRRTCEVLVYIDLARCLQAGLPFVTSANGVILSVGDAGGYIRPQFFKEVLSAKTKQRVPGFVPPAASPTPAPAPAVSAKTAPAAAAPPKGAAPTATPPAAKSASAPAAQAPPAVAPAAPAAMTWAERVGKQST